MNSLEERIYNELTSKRHRKKFKVKYEPEYLEYTIIRRYLPDFVLTFKDGRKLYIETKGYLRPDDRSKMVAIKQKYPDLDIAIIFEKDNKLSRTSKIRYSDWAKINKFKFSIGKTDETWFE